MSETLFDFGDSSSMSASPLPVRDEQIAAIRGGFNDVGILTQQDRKTFVESVILEPAVSLRGLTAVQARQVIDRLKDRQAPKKSSTGSSWDDREEDTWIDRL